MAAVTSIRELRQKLGRAGLLDSTSVAIRRASKKETPTMAGLTMFGWVSTREGVLLKDVRGRAMINLTDDGLRSLESAVETVGHKLFHIREVLAGAGHDEHAANHAGKEFLETFKKRLAQLD